MSRLWGSDQAAVIVTAETVVTKVDWRAYLAEQLACIDHYVNVDIPEGGLFLISSLEALDDAKHGFLRVLNHDTDAWSDIKVNDDFRGQRWRDLDSDQYVCVLQVDRYQDNTVTIVVNMAAKQVIEKSDANPVDVSCKVTLTFDSCAIKDITVAPIQLNPLMQGHGISAELLYSLLQPLRDFMHPLTSLVLQGEERAQLDFLPDSLLMKPKISAQLFWLSDDEQSQRDQAEAILCAKHLKQCVDRLTKTIDVPVLLKNLKPSYRTGITREAFRQFDRLYCLAGDASRLLFRVRSASDKMTPEAFEYRLSNDSKKHWRAAGSETLLLLVDVTPCGSNDVDVKVIAATKQVLHSCDHVGHDIHASDQSADVALLLSMRLSFDTDVRVVNEINFRSRAIAPGFRCHGVMRQFSVGMLRMIEPICDADAIVTSFTVHPATWLFMSTSHEDYKMRRQYIDNYDECSDFADWTGANKAPLKSVLAVQGSCLVHNDKKSTKASMLRRLQVTSNHLLWEVQHAKKLPAAVQTTIGDRLDGPR